MNYSFEYIDIILLAMIAGFIFLRLRGILGKRTGFQGKSPPQFKEVIKSINNIEKSKTVTDKFDDEAQKEFLKGAKIAYETIITDFSDNDNKITNSKPLLNKEIYNQFNDALKERSAKGYYAEITFIGVNLAEIKEHKKTGNILNVTVNFIAEVITCIRDKDKKDWEDFLSSNKKLPNKDNDKIRKKNLSIKSIDLHGYSLDEANKIVKNFIIQSYNKKISKLVVVTGKGLHSNNQSNPYVSKDLSILKYSVPEYIKKDDELMKMIIEIKEASIEDGGTGSFYVYLKKNK